MFMRQIVSRGYFCRDPFVDHFLDANLVVGFELTHQEFDDTPFDLVGYVVGPLKLLDEIVVVEWYTMVLMDVICELTDNSLILDSKVQVGGW